MIIKIDCPHCGTGDIEVGIEIDTWPSPGRLSGPPENCYPAEAAEWHIEEPVVCDHCCEPIDEVWIDRTYGDQVQELAAEAMSSNGDEDCDDEDDRESEDDF